MSGTLSLLPLYAFILWTGTALPLYSPPKSTILCGWEGVQSLGNPLANGTTALIQKENMEHGEKCTQSLPHTRASVSLSTTNFILTGLEVKPALLCIQRQ